MRTPLDRYKQDFVARTRTRWGTLFPEPGVTEFAKDYWRLLAFVPVVASSAFVLVAFGLWAQSRELLSRPASVVVFWVVLGVVVWRMFWLRKRIKRTAGRLLGVTAEELGTLDISDPKKMAEAIAEIRRARGERRA